MRTSFRSLVVIAICGLASPAAAQPAPQAAPGAPAAAGANGGANTGALILGASGYGGTWTTNGSRSTEFGSDLDLTAHAAGRNSDFQVSAFSGMRRYAGTDFWSHSASAAFAATPNARTSIGFNGTFGYSQLMNLIPNTPGAVGIGAPSQALDFSVVPRTTQSLGGGAQFGYSVSTRSSFVFTYDARQTSSGSGIKTEWLDQYAQLGFENRFRRRASLRVSYAYRDANYQTGVAQQLGQMQQHGLTVEFARQWAHSATRQTELRITGGPSAVYGNGPSRYLGTAGVSLDGKFSRNWTITGEIAREVSFIDGVGQPFLANVFRGRVNGQLSRSLDVIVTATSSVGNSPFNANTTSYNWRGGTARLEWASRSWMLFGEYVYRWYTLANLPLAAGTAETSPSSARVGLSWRKAIKK